MTAVSSEVVDFFVSRAGSDSAVAEQIAAMLEQMGYRVILQQWDFRNRNFIERMHASLAGNARVIALLSPDYLHSEYCAAEWQSVLATDPLNTHSRLIVLKVKDCKPIGLLSAIAYWDLVQAHGNETAVRQLLQAAINQQIQRQAGASMSALWRPPVRPCHPSVRANPTFIGRENNLAALMRSFAAARQQSRTASCIYAIHGLGGVGKSMLAREMAWRSRDSYAGIWLVNGVSRDRIANGLIELGKSYFRGLDESPDRIQAAHRTLEFMSENGFELPWLLIYDDVSNPQVLEGLLPESNVHVLITTRWTDWHGVAEAFALDVFEKAAAISLLEQRSGRQDPEGAAQLAADLGWHPLALDHAGAYCRRTGMSFASYGELLREMILSTPRGAEYTESVSASFNLAIDQAAEAAPDAERLMSILAFTAPSRIPLERLLAKEMNGAERVSAVAALSEISLLNVEPSEEGSLVTMHRLVREVMRARVEQRGHFDQYARLTLKLLARAFPQGGIGPSDVRSWPACARLLPHAMAVLADAPRSGPRSDDTSFLMNQAGVYLKARAQHADAEPFLRGAVDISGANHGSDSPQVAAPLSNLGLLLHDLGRYAEAEPMLRRSMAIQEAKYGRQHPAVARALNNLGVALTADRRFQDAEPMLREALAIDEHEFGPQHPTVARDLNNLALLMHSTGRFDEAEPAYKRAIAISEVAFGADHPVVATGLSNLTLVLIRLQRWQEAEEIIDRALAIDEVAFGPDHPHVARDLNNKARLRTEQDRKTEAAPLFQRSLEINARMLGSAHPHTIKIRENIAELDSRKAPEPSTTLDSTDAAPPAPVMALPLGGALSAAKPPAHETQGDGIGNG